MAVFEITFSVYKQTYIHTNNQPTTQAHRHHTEKISRSALLSAAGATKNEEYVPFCTAYLISNSDGLEGNEYFICPSAVSDESASVAATVNNTALIAVFSSTDCV